MSSSDLCQVKSGGSEPHTCHIIIPGFTHAGFPCICNVETDLLTSISAIRTRLVTVLQLPSTPWETVEPSRYARGRPAILHLQTNPPSQPVPLAATLLAYNTYLLDGFVRTSLPAGYQKSPQPTYRSYFRPFPGAGPQCLIFEAARSAVRLRLEQCFHDGNHRTATLALYEYLAGHGLMVTAAPLEVYMTLSLGEDLKLEKTTELLVALLTRRHRFLKPEANGHAYREQVKMLPVWSSLVYRIGGLVDDSTISLERRRAMVRWLRREQALVHRCLLLILTQDPGKRYQLLK